MARTKSARKSKKKGASYSSKELWDWIRDLIFIASLYEKDEEVALATPFAKDLLRKIGPAFRTFKKRDQGRRLRFLFTQSMTLFLAGIYQKLSKGLLSREEALRSIQSYVRYLYPSRNLEFLVPTVRQIREQRGPVEMAILNTALLAGIGEHPLRKHRRQGRAKLHTIPNGRIAAELTFKNLFEVSDHLAKELSESMSQEHFGWLGTAYGMDWDQE